MKEIKFCENNFIHGADEVMEKLQEEFPNITIEVEPCLGYCGDCANGPFALVEDDFIEAESSDELYDTIVERLK
ncbi:MAG: DUF1450 domain-containing protein [Bacillota bacterium]|nr:DUF1450 domain-containing protein [Bacillota bacterium]